MNTTRVLTLTAAAFLAVAPALPVQAALIAYDGFDYTPGTVSGGNGGTGWTSAWSEDFNAGSGGLSYSDLEVTGNRVALTAGANNSRNIASVGTGTVWISFIGLGDPAGGKLGLNSTAFSQPITFGNDPWESNSAWRMSGTQVNPATPYQSQVFGLLRIDFDAGAGGTAENAYFWINPDLDTEPLLGTQNAQMLDIASFTLGGVRISGFNAGFQLDEIRIGTTFADVTPTAIPEPSVATSLGLGLVLLAGRLGRRRMK